MKNLLVFVFFTFFLTISFANTAVAENIYITPDANISLDEIEEITAEDLGLKEPTILPGSPLYPIKTMIEKIQELLTFQKDSKMELNIRFANKRLLEARKLIKKGKIDKALEVLQRYVKRIEKAKERLSDKQEKKEKLNNKAKKKLKEDEGFFTENYFKHIRILERVQKDAPEVAKATIQDVIDQSKERAREEISEMSEEGVKLAKERINEMLENISSDEIGKIIYLEILNEVKQGLNTKLQESMGEIESEKLQELGKWIEENKLSAEKQQKLINGFNSAINTTQEKAYDLQDKIMNIWPTQTKEKFEEIKKTVEERSEENNGSINIF